MEIERLHEMLLEAGIEHEWIDRGERLIPKNERGREIYESSEFWRDTNWGYQIIVRDEDGDRLISAIEGFGTYGYSDGKLFGESSDLIEIMGLLTPEESECDTIVGWLTAENVFERIRKAVGK